MKASLWGVLKALPQKSSLQWRLIISFMLVVFIILLVVLWGMSIFIREHLLHVKQGELTRRGLEIARNLQKIEGIKNVDEAEMSENMIAEIANYIDFVDNYTDARVWVVDEHKKIVAISSPDRGRGLMSPPLPPPSGAMHEHGWQGGGMGMGMGGKKRNNVEESEKFKSFIAELDLENKGKRQFRVIENPYYQEEMVIVAVPILTGDGRLLGAVILNAPLVEISMFMRSTYYYLALAGILGTLLSLLLVSRLTRHIIHPLKLIQSATEEIAKGNYAVRVPINSSDEIGKLGQAVNHLVTELSIYMKEVNKLEQLRRDFVANVSHELRTPLTIIRGYTEAFADGTIEEGRQREHFLLQMREEIMRLERLIKELLDLSKLQNENFQLPMELVPINAIIDSVVGMMSQKAQGKDVSLQLLLCAENPMMMANPDRIVQLVLILTDNAVKYTAAGGTVKICTSLRGSVNKDYDELRLLVSDSGSGIAEEDLPYIFERFYKADKSHRRAEGGVGLGLAIAKQIVLLHNGKINVKSEVNVGSEFVVDLPLVR